MIKIPHIYYKGENDYQNILYKNYLKIPETKDKYKWF